MKKCIYSFYSMCIWFASVSYVYAQEAQAKFTPSQFVPCEGSSCTFTHLIILANNVIEFSLFKIASPVAALMIAYAGFRIMTSGGDMQTLQTGKKLAWNVLIGYLIALGAWLIVRALFRFTSSDFSKFT